MAEREVQYLEKAEESLAGAQSELANRRYDNAANRSYYAVYQAAIQALEDAGFQSRGRQASWSHEGLQAAFARELITRRKMYPSDLRAVLLRNQELRLTADYQRHAVTQTQATRAIGRAEVFVAAVRRRGNVL